MTVDEDGTRRIVNNNSLAHDLAQDHGVPSRQVIGGLDTLRFITAMWVAFYHGARFPVDRVILPDSSVNKLILLLGNTTWNGTAAVTVFFVISGFLIHVGNVGKKSVDTKYFWLRRGTRIGVPLLATLMIAWSLGDVHILDGMLWTVYAELAYYALYPLLLPLIHRFGIGRVLATSLAISLAMIASHPREIYLFAFGLKYTWLFNAPLWLMGCYLAEQRNLVNSISIRFPIWFYRFAAVAYCYASTIVANHLNFASIGYTWTIWFFGAFCIFWLDAEMTRGTGRSTLATLERFGLAGYSLYLMHEISIKFVDLYYGDLSPLYSWVAKLTLIGISTWGFYRLVEWPAHMLARSLVRKKKPCP